MSAEPRIPRHRFYAKEHHVLLAREDKDKSFIRASGIDRIGGGGGGPPQTHVWTIGTSSNAYGFVDGAFGNLVPNTLSGYQVEYFQALPTDRFRIKFLDDAQIVGVTEITATAPGVPAPIVMVWVPVLSVYESAIDTVVAQAVRDALGQQLALTLSINATLDEQVAAILDGRDGTAFDLTDLTTLFRDAAGTIPATAFGQTIHLCESRRGLFSIGYVNASAALCPVSSAGGLVFDGVDDGYSSGSPDLLNMLSNASAVTLGIAFTVNEPPTRAMGPILLPRPANSTQTGFDILMSAAGVIAVRCRRTDADGIASVSNPTAVVQGVENVILAEADYAGSGKLSATINGFAPVAATIPGAVGGATMIATASRLGQTGNATARLGGTIKKVFLAKFALTAGEKTIVEAWLGEA